MSDVLQAMYHGEREEARRLAAGRDLTVFEAAALGDVARLEVLLDEEPARASAIGDDGFHALGLACFFGNVDAARVLLANGADVNALSQNENIHTAAIHAAAAAQGVDEETRYALIALALEYGADPNLEQRGGFRAIDAARQNGDRRVEQLLLENGAEA